MQVVARELQEKCTSHEQFLATQVPQFRGTVFKSLSTVSCSTRSVARMVMLIYMLWGEGGPGFVWVVLCETLGAFLPLFLHRALWRQVFRDNYLEVSAIHRQPLHPKEMRSNPSSTLQQKCQTACFCFLMPKSNPALAYSGTECIQDTSHHLYMSLCMEDLEWPLATLG